MGIAELNFEITKLGECRIPSPMAGVRFVRDDEHGLVHSSLLEMKGSCRKVRNLRLWNLPGQGRKSTSTLPS